MTRTLPAATDAPAFLNITHIRVSVMGICLAADTILQLLLTLTQLRASFTLPPASCFSGRCHCFLKIVDTTCNTEPAVVFRRSHRRSIRMRFAGNVVRAWVQTSPAAFRRHCWLIRIVSFMFLTRGFVSASVAIRKTSSRPPRPQRAGFDFMPPLLDPLRFKSTFCSA